MSRLAVSQPYLRPEQAELPTDRKLDERTESQLRLLLASGGDCRIQPVPATRRNVYGTPIVPAPDEIWFSSSTASAISERGFLAAGRSLAELIGRADGHMPLPDWFDRVRERLSALYCPDGCEAVLTPSGTDAELVTVAVASSLMDGPLCNIVVGPGETGSGVMMAAGGSHFQDTASYDPSVTRGRRLDGWASREIDTRAVDLRDSSGRPRSPGEIDTDVAIAAGEALARGCCVLLHILDTSKTGLSGTTRETATDIARRAPGRVMTVVDSCQLRCSAQTVRDDLSRGFMVQITGSKFAGGPVFCGALLLPEPVCGPLADCGPLPEGFAAYSAVLDWPARFRKGPASALTETVNIGLALRWYAALAELQALESIDQALRDKIAARFEDIVAEILINAPFLSLADDETRGPSRRPGMIPLIVTDERGRPATPEAGKKLHDRLRRPEPGPAIHLGQPVAIGERTALRICISAQNVISVAERLQTEPDMDMAFEPVAEQVEALLRKLSLACN